MSELNNRKPNKLFKFVVIYTILIITATAILIILNYKYNINISEYFLATQNKDTNLYENNTGEQIESKKINYDAIKRTTLLDKYYINNIELETNKLTYGNIVDYDSYDGNPVYKVNVEYVKISGLKDKKIQNKINNSIEESVKKLVLDEEIYDDDIEKIYIVAGTEGDYSTADLLSIPVNKEIKYKENKGHDEELYVTIYCPSINYRLDNAEEVKFEDLFTKDASIKSILNQTIYKSLAFEYGFNEETGDGDLDEVDYGKIENDVYNLTTLFNNQKEKVFWFNQENISFIVNNICFNVKNADFIDYININNITNPQNSIYENGDNPKINYAFSIPFMSSFEYFDKVSSRDYLSIFNWYRYAGKIMEDNSDTGISYSDYTTKLTSSITELTNAIKNDGKKENGKGYVYNIYNYQEQYYNENQENLGQVFWGEKVEVDLENFDENIETLYALNCKEHTGGEYVFSFSNLIYNNDDYKVWDILVRDVDNDGQLEIGQKLYDKEEWDEFYSKEYEY